MSDVADFLIVCIVTIAITAVVAGFCGGSVGFSAGYEQGQIDAANGIQTMELVQNPDKTTSWKKRTDNGTKPE